MEDAEIMIQIEILFNTGVGNRLIRWDGSMDCFAPKGSRNMGFNH